ncbi:hypothetical protein [Roseateles sp.]|uniref:hypothetical protein n=1 Tax=Roseateles sp. TaxID=1971397 RepID=UPI003266158F
MTYNAPCGRGFVTLLESFRASGGTAPGDVLGRLLEDRQAGEAVSLAKLVHSAQVFGFEWRGSLWIPMFQFNADDLSLAAPPQAVRRELPQGWSGWAVALWFATPNAGLCGQRPVDLLRLDLAPVLQAAQALPPLKARPAVQLQRTQQRAAHA